MIAGTFRGVVFLTISSILEHFLLGADPIHLQTTIVTIANFRQSFKY